MQSDTYFPDGLFPRGYTKRYDRALAELKESVLSRASIDAAECYRFLSYSYWKEFKHRVVRVTSLAHETIAVVKYVGGYGDERECREFHCAVSAAQWEAIQAALTKTDFWSMPTQEWETMGIDGGFDVIEGVRARQYHVVERWCPYQSAYFDLCKCFLAIDEGSH
jgi:hypothetical protein